MIKPMIGKQRCFGNGKGKELLAQYHDEEWGVPVHDDKKHFEMLILEGAQAGLNWEVVLKKRENYMKAFNNFDPNQVAEIQDQQLESLRHDRGIIRNRLKIYSARKNAIAFLKIQQEYGSFNSFIWSFVGGSPIHNTWKSLEEVPITTSISDKLSKVLKERGMSFVGSKIIYAYMQAVGLVNDHLVHCWCFDKDRQ